MTNREKLRYRREMHQRIRELVAERRQARISGTGLADGGDASAADQRVGHDEEALVGG
ncbi:hypothetical protein [Plantactinospora sp. KBS50]|uniref:hypothetical protein n=1 Tax=Plantactinospora sp. KBS50 TaxID=2024580 RepID=UPI0012FDF248|nr:hypothetical protein [Plantactinospora sp. KBS50]